MNFKKIIILCFLLWIYTQVFGQIKYNTKRYYEYKNKAEMQIIYKNYKKALKYYKLSLKYLSQFGVDSYNACLCAIESNKIDDAIFFSAKLIDKNVPITYFERNNIFSKMTTHARWKIFMSKNPESKIDKKLRNRIDSICKLDQKYRWNFNRDSMLRIDSLNKIELWKIFNEYKYPTEQLIGLQMVKGNIDWGWSNFDILMIHQVKLYPSEYIEFLERTVNEGLARNTELAMHSKNFSPLYDAKYTFFCLKEADAILVKIKNETYTCCCKEENLIDENRKRIYMCSVEEQRQKIIFRQKNGSKFKIGNGISEYNSEKGDEDLIKIKETLLNLRKFVLYTSN